jgi:ketosteroid isomerase-like protein
MTTKDTIDGYFRSLEKKNGWEVFLSDGMVFTSFTSPMRQITGKNPFLEATKRFYSMIRSVKVRDLVIDGEKACALTRYELQPPTGSAFASDVAELFTVENGKIDSFSIYFDSAPYPK